MRRKLFGRLGGPPPVDDPVFGRLVFERRPVTGRRLYREIESRWENLRIAVAQELIDFQSEVLEEEIANPRLARSGPKVRKCSGTDIE